MASCLSPIKTKNKGTGQMNTNACGKCLNCRKMYASGWSFRLMEEDKISSSAYFLTLTYDTDHVPITKNGFMGLNKRDLQSFFKRLRSRISRGGESFRRAMLKQPLKYYSVGEYGGLSRRPHYHVILFNAPLEFLIGERDARFVRSGTIQLDGKLPYQCPSWTKGHITVGMVSDASVGYTLKYMVKPPQRPMHRNDDRLMQFSLMSKGLGASYLSKKMVNWHLSNELERMYINLKDGKKAAMPRYYKDKIYGPTNYVDKETGEVTINLKRKRLNDYNQQKQEKKLAEERAQAGRNYYRDRLEKAEAGQNTLKRLESERNSI